MLIHDRFVFLHVPKTGGTFLRHVLARELPDCRSLPGMPGSAHYGWEEIPPAAAGRPVLAFVRNPWDWYVSWYSFAVNQPRRSFEHQCATQPLFRRLFTGASAPDLGGNGETDRAVDFATTLRRACKEIAGGNDVEALPATPQWLHLAKRLREGHDFYSARFLATMGGGLDSSLLTVGRFESLLDDLERFLAEAGVELPPGALARIRAEKPRGASRHGSYREYYDDDLRRLVATSCGALIEQFDYRF